jgi:mannosyltransferase OCH1-like enzyme
MCERIIHQIWMQGHHKAPEYFLSYSKRIRDMHPEWPYVFWDEARIQSLVGTQGAWRAKYATFVHLHQRVDFAKLLILFTHGGIVIDADAYTVRKLDSLFDEHADASFIVSEVRQFAKPVGWIGNLVACGTAGTCVNNGCFIAKAGSRVLAMIIDRFLALPSCEPGTGKMECIKATTGPQVFHRLVREYAQDPANRLVVLEYDKLEPCISTSCEISERTYIVHAHEMTWFNPAFVSFVRIYLRHHAAVNVAAILFILIVLALGSFLAYRAVARRTQKLQN